MTMERCSLPSVAILSAAANKNERGGMRSRQYRLEEGSVGARNGRIEGKPAHDWDYPCTRDEPMGAGADSGAHRDADLAQILSVPSLSGGKKPVPPPKMVSENAQIRAGRRVNARSLRESARCVSQESETRFGFQGLGRMLTCLLGEGGCVCGKVSRLAARKSCFRGRLSRPRTLLRPRSGDGSRSVALALWNSVGKDSFFPVWFRITSKPSVRV